MNDNGDTILSTDADNTSVGVNNVIPQTMNYRFPEQFLHLDGP